MGKWRYLHTAGVLLWARVIFGSQRELPHRKFAVAAVKPRQGACFMKCSPFPSWHQLPAAFKQMPRGIVQN